VPVATSKSPHAFVGLVATQLRPYNGGIGGVGAEHTPWQLYIPGILSPHALVDEHGMLNNGEQSTSIAYAEGFSNCRTVSHNKENPSALAATNLLKVCSLSIVGFLK